MTHCSRDTECDVYVVHDNSGDYDSLMGRATTSVAADDDVYNQPCTTLDTPANMTAGDDDGNSNNNNNDVVVHGKQRSRYAGLLIRSDSSSDSDDDDKNSSSDDNPSSHDASGGSAAARRTQSPPARVPVQRNTPTAQQRTSAAVTAAPPVTGTAAVPTAAARTVATRSALTSTTPAAAQAAAAAAAVTKTTAVIAERASNRSSSSTGDEAHSDTNRVPQQEHRQQQEEEESEKKVAAAVGATTTTTPSRKSDAAMETGDDTVASGSSSNNKEEEDNNKPVACAHNADNVGDSAEDEDDVCCICLEPYTDENPMYRGACQHQFHVPCLLAWKNRCNTCPLCNMDTLRGVGDSEVARPVVSRPDTSADAALARQLQEHYRRQARRVRRASREALHAHAAAVATATATATSTTATNNNIATTRQQQHAALPLSQHTQQDGVAVERGPSTATLQLQETAVPMYGPLPHTSRNTKAQRVAAVGNRRNSQTHAHALRVAAIAAERAQRRVDEDSSHKSSCSVM